MARARRRVPYSLGPDRLDPDPEKAAKRPTREQEEILSKDIRELYGRLVPTLESEQRRKSFVAKLESILSERWPEHPIKVNVFGSTGNSLGTSDSDVDCSITTENKELNRVCSIAELLASKGMERVVCVSSAKVPIVKLWDPEHQVACDLNVNNPMALENTALIRSYVEIDDRVRPLAMIIKHWAKRRILNDAGMFAQSRRRTVLTLQLSVEPSVHIRGSA
jgi:DNA polymerase sigma